MDKLKLPRRSGVTGKVPRTGADQPLTQEITMTEKQIKTGRRWAYGVMLAMLALSVAGNVSHTYHLDPTPSARKLLYGIFWPLIAWGAVELFVRVPWRSVASHRLVRWGGVLLAAIVAALVSYRHLRGLLKADGEEWTVYTVGPLAVDGLMIMSTLALLLTRNLTEKSEQLDDPTPRLVARIAELESQIQARDAFLDITTQPAYMDVPESREVREQYAIATGNGKSEGMKLADLLPAPVSPAPIIPGLQLGEPMKLDGWTDPSKTATKPARTPRASWDQAKAREMILAGATKAEVAEAVGKDVKTIQRLRARMIRDGELTA